MAGDPSSWETDARISQVLEGALGLAVQPVTSRPVVWVSQFSSLSLSVKDEVNTTSLLQGL